MAERGLLLINLGSPEAPTKAAVKTYLNEFLTDKFVVDLPAPVRQVLVRGLITPLRAQKSADAYAKIWSPMGSPLVQYTREFAAAVASRLPEYEVRWAMRYGTPSIASQIKDWKINDLTVVPLYPQYAESSTRTAIEKVREQLARSGFNKPVRILQDFFDQPEFIACEARKIRQAAEVFRPDHVLLSFHGLPEHHMTKLHGAHCFQPGCCESLGPQNRLCYRAQCMATARAIQAQLQFANFSVSFQSRLGRRPWIKPYTDFVVSGLAKAGVKRVLVACPSFVADCLETLEEVQMRLREQFKQEGGDDLQLVPALNSDPEWATAFCEMIQRRDLAWQSR